MPEQKIKALDGRHKRLSKCRDLSEKLGYIAFCLSLVAIGALLQAGLVSVVCVYILALCLFRLFYLASRNQIYRSINACWRERCVLINEEIQSQALSK